MRILLVVGLVPILLGGCASFSSDNAIPTVDPGAIAPTATAATGSAESMRREDGRARSAGFEPSVNTPALNGGETTMAISLPASHQVDLEAYRIGPQDVVEIAVFKVPELSRTVQVSERGAVNLPLVGEIFIAGKTARDFEKELASRLGKTYLQKPQVNVLVREYNSQRVVIEGAVNKPGVLPMRGSMSLLQAIALSQGMEDISDETVLVFRGEGGQRRAARYDIAEIRSGKSQDPQLQNGDVVVAGASVVRKNVNMFMKLLPIAGVFTLL